MKRFFIALFVIFTFSSQIYSKIRLLSDPDIPYEEFLNEDLPDVSSGLLEAKMTDSGDYALYAKTSIPSGTPILSIPSHGVFSSFEDYGRSYYFFEMGRSDHRDFLMGRLLTVKHLKHFGFFHDYYIRTPNLPNLENTIYYWSPENYEFFLNRSGFINNDEFNRKTTEKALEYLREFNLPLVDKYMPKLPKELFNMSELLWAHALINQKAFDFSQEEFCLLNGFDAKNWKREIPGLALTDAMREKASKKGLALIPFFDLIGDEVVGVTLPNEGELIYDLEDIKKLGIESRRLKVDGESFTGQKGFDLFLESISPKNFREFWEIKEKNIVLKANKNYQPGDQIKYFKGFKSNAKILRDFGTTLDQNIFSGVAMPLVFHRFNEDEKKFLHSIGVATHDEIFSKNTSTLYFHHFQLNYKFVNYLRVFVMKAEELMPVFNETKHLEIIKRGRFKNAYLEGLVWFNYFVTLDSRHTFGTSIVEDRKDLENEIKQENWLRVRMLEGAIQEKFVIYKHLFGAWSKWAKLFHYDMNTGYIKKAIMNAILDPEAGFFYSEQD